MADATSGYDAFISYSHTLDGALARALQTGLEQFAKPWYRPRALRVFRDTTSLSANPGLWSSIEKALAHSAWLVLMASPEAARSRWVDREVAWWLANKSPQRVLVVLTEGEFAWDETGQGDGRARPCHQRCAAPSPRNRAGWTCAGYTTWTRWTRPTHGCGRPWLTSVRPYAKSPRTCWSVSISTRTGALCGWLVVASLP